MPSAALTIFGTSNLNFSKITFMIFTASSSVTAGNKSELVCCKIDEYYSCKYDKTRTWENMEYATTPEVARRIAAASAAIFGESFIFPTTFEKASMIRSKYD